MEDEECDLETLAAFLDEDSDIEDGDDPNAQTGPTGGNEQEDLCFSDSDDDNLDTLASLVEEDVEGTEAGETTHGASGGTTHGTSPDQPCIEKNKTKTIGSNISPRSRTAEGQHKKSSDTCSSVAAESPQIISPDSLNAAKLQEELRQMQERMIQLQQQLIQQQSLSLKQANTLSHTLTPGQAQPAGTIAQQRFQSRSLLNSMKQQKTSPKSVRTPNVSKGNKSQGEIDYSQNLFFTDEQSETKQTKPGINKKIASKKDAPEKSEAYFPDSDSDWDDMEGEQSEHLSKGGMEIKKLLHSGPRKREAHSANCSPSVLNKQLPEARWNRARQPSGSQTKTTQNSPTYPPKGTPGVPQKKPGGPPAQKSSAVSLSSKFSKENDDFIVFSDIRIVNPKVSGEMLKLKMEGRKLIKMSRLHTKLKTADLEGNWVTFGVLVHKSETRKSSNGNTYIIWKLSDLDDCDKVMTFFLFSEVYKHHWKSQLGTVLGLLNPNMMQKAEKFQSESSFTIDHPGQLLVIGHSKDFGSCKGKTKAGKICSNFINKRQGEYCTYHVQSAYKKTSAKRGDLQSGFSGVVPKAFQKKIIPSGSHVFYGGQTYSTLPSCAKAINKKSISLKHLHKHNESMQKGKVTTLTLHSLEAQDEALLQKLNGEKEQAFMDVLTTPTVGSMNLVKHLIKKEIKDKDKDDSDDSKVMVQSISAASLLKQHRQQMKDLRQQKASAAPSFSGPKLGRGFEPGQDIFFGGSQKKQPVVQKNAGLAKKRAIAKVLSKGGIAKDDPNVVKKNLTSPEAAHRIRKRVADNLEPDDGTSGNVDEPPQKRSRYLGNVDLNSKEVQKLLKAKSSHSGALAELEEERREKYFGELEKKEMYEQKMASVMEMKCTAYTCHQCKYTATGTSDLCKAEGHKVTQVKAVKRFFKCKDCDNRTMTLQRYPDKTCRSCGGKSFLRTSMWKEKTGPKLESEILHVTGDSAKFLDSQMR